MHVRVYKPMQVSLDTHCHWVKLKSVSNLWLVEKRAGTIPRYDRHYPGVISISRAQLLLNRLCHNLLTIVYYWSHRVWKEFIRQHRKDCKAPLNVVEIPVSCTYTLPHVFNYYIVLQFTCEMMRIIFFSYSGVCGSNQVITCVDTMFVNLSLHT